MRKLRHRWGNNCCEVRDADSGVNYQSLKITVDLFFLDETQAPCGASSDNVRRLVRAGGRWVCRESKALGRSGQQWKAKNQLGSGGRQSPANRDEKLDVTAQQKREPRRCDSESFPSLRPGSRSARHLRRFPATLRAYSRLLPRRPPGRLTALPTAQAQAGTRGRGGGPERRRAAPSLRVPGGVSVQPCLAARGGEAGSVGGALCEAAAAESGGGGHSCRRAGISAADGEPRGGGGRPSRLPLPTGSPAGESRTWVAGAGGHGWPERAELPPAAGVGLRLPGSPVPQQPLLHGRQGDRLLRGWGRRGLQPPGAPAEILPGAPGRHHQVPPPRAPAPSSGCPVAPRVLPRPSPPASVGARMEAAEGRAARRGAAPALGGHGPAAVRGPGSCLAASRSRTKSCAGPRASGGPRWVPAGGEAEASCAPRRALWGRLICGSGPLARCWQAVDACGISGLPATRATFGVISRERAAFPAESRLVQIGNSLAVRVTVCWSS